MLVTIGGGTCRVVIILKPAPKKKSVMRCWMLRLLIVLSTVFRVDSMRFKCSDVCCYLYDLASKEDTFAYKYIPSNFSLLSVENVMTEHVDHSILENVPSFIDHLNLAKSYTLKWVSVPRSVKSLMISMTNLRRIDIEANSSMNYLGISVCELVHLPDSFQNVPMLEWLFIAFCKLQGLNMANLCNNTRLRSLNLMGNRIRYVVNSATRHCGMYDTLTSLTLSDNLLTTVSMELFNVLRKMDSLYLQNNKIDTLSGHLIHSSVVEIRLDGNKLVDVDVCGWTVPSLSTIFFDRNHLTSMPKCLDHLTNVSTLTMRNNRLFNFSIESVASMRKLNSLDLSCNKLTTVTLNTVHFPPELAMLNIEYNNLTTLDLFFVPVRSLEVRVSYNLISSFDASGASRNVSKLSMYQNLIICAWHTLMVNERDQCNKSDGNVLHLHNEQLRGACHC